MTDTYRALCAELLAAADEYAGMNPYMRLDNAMKAARAALANSPDQDDATLRSIREHTPRYRMTVIISTNDACIDTRMDVICLALDSGTEILESVSLPEKLSPYGNS